MAYPKLRGAIREKFGTQEAFASAMKMHPATISSRLQDKSDWSKAEIQKAAALLDIQPDDVYAYFFGN